MIQKIKDSFFDASKGAYRIRQLTYTGISSIAAKGINALVTLVSVPLAYNYLGEERYGLMMIVLSVISMLHFADLGLGFSLQNKIPVLLLEDSKMQLKKYISSTFLLLVAFSVLLFAISLIISPYIVWSEVLNVKSTLAVSEAEASIFVFALCFIISLPLSIIQKIQNGYQEGYYNEGFKTIGNLIGLLLLIYFIQQGKGVPYLILALYGSITLSLLGNFTYKLLWKDRDLAPSWKNLEISCLKELFSDGVKFFVLQIMAILTIALDSLIIARYINAEAVAGYNIGYRIIMLLMVPALAFISPLLFAFNDAIARDDINWIVKTIRKVIKICFLMSLIMFIAMFFGGNIFIKYWIGEHALLKSNLILAFATYIFFYNFYSLFATVMLSDRFLTFNFVFFTIAAIVTISLKIVFIQTIGIQGVLYATVCGLTLIFIVPTAIKLKKENYL